MHRHKDFINWSVLPGNCYYISKCSMPLSGFILMASQCPSPSDSDGASRWPICAKFSPSFIYPFIFVRSIKSRKMGVVSITLLYRWNAGQFHLNRFDGISIACEQLKPKCAIEYETETIAGIQEPTVHSFIKLLSIAIEGFWMKWSAKEMSRELEIKNGCDRKDYLN